MEYKKSYKGLTVWMILFLAAVFAIPFIPGANAAQMTRLTVAATLWGCFALMAVILVTEQVCWINGVTFEQARDAGSERRKAFAWAHVKRFGWAGLIGTAVMLVAYLLGWPFWIDMTVCFALLIAAALSCIGVKL